MSEGTAPIDRQLPEAQGLAPHEPMILRLEDLPQYGSSDVEPTPLNPRLKLGIALGLVVAIAIGAFLGLRPYYQRQQLRSVLNQQLAAGELVAAETTLDQFAALFPDHPDLPRYRGQVLVGQAKFIEAEAALAPHVARMPEDVPAGMALAYVYGVDQILRRVPLEERELRQGMIVDWTDLFGYTVVGVNAGVDNLGLTAESGAQVMSILRKAQGKPGAESQPIDAAITAMQLLQGDSPEHRQVSLAQLSDIEGVNMPSFQSYAYLADHPIAAPEPLLPPLAHLPGPLGIPDAPVPGSIDPLDGMGDTGPVASPNLPLTGRGGSALAPTETPSENILENGTPAALANTGGRGPAPRVRPVNFGSVIKVEADGSEHERWYTQLINLDQAGNYRAFVGDEVTMPMTGYEVVIRSIDAEAKRVVLEEKGRGVYVWVKPTGGKWFWDTSDAENDFGKLRKDKYGTEQN